MLKALPGLQNYEAYNSEDVDLLFTNISLKEKIDCNIHKMCNEKLLKPICKNSSSLDCSTNWQQIVQSSSTVVK